MMTAAIQERDWKILPHPSYSPDLAHQITTSSTLSNNLCKVSFNNDAELQNWFNDGQTGGFLQAWDRKPARTLGGSRE
jgi:hypothetical protein